MESLAAQGVRVFEDGVKQFACFYSEHITVGSRPLAVLDDGGDLIVALAPMMASGHRWLAIETTTKGATLVRKSLPELEFLDLPNSPIKSDSSLAIAVSCVASLRSILRHSRMVGEDAILVGYGAIGQHAARLLTAMGLDVLVVESDPRQASHAAASGYITVQHLEDALKRRKARYIIGCSGARVLQPRHLPLLAENVVLASVSSQDAADLTLHLEHNARLRRLPGVGTEYVIGARTLLSIADGDAVNLYYSEGVAEPEFDAVTSLFLAATVLMGSELALGLSRSSIDASLFVSSYIAVERRGCGPAVNVAAETLTTASAS